MADGNTNSTKPKQTALCDEHIRLNGRMVDFAGWYMPVQYVGIKEEHVAVRKNVGLFDVSHMGEVFVRGPKSFETLQWLTTNNVDLLKEGEAQYSLLPNFEGGLVDDIIVYCIKLHQEYLVCVNASNADKDFDWMKKNNKGADITNESSKWSQIAVQGPQAIQLVKDVLGNQISEIKSFNFKFLDYVGSNHTASKVIAARTGYTGEAGFEVFVPNENVVSLWRELLDKGEQYGVMPIGLGARDTLRTEMKYSLYGNEIDDKTNPIEAGLGWVVKLDKGEFIGRDIIARVKEKGPTRKLVGFKMIEKGIPRHGYKLVDFDNHTLGVVTSGTMSPTLNEPIGIGYVEVKNSAVGSEILVEIRDRKVKAQVVKTPFVRREDEI